MNTFRFSCYRMNEKFEEAIQLLINQDYCEVKGWFSSQELSDFNSAIRTRYHDDDFRLASIGKQASNQENEAIRSDQIYWLDEKNPSPAASVFFRRIIDFVDYLNRTCFAGIRSFEFHYAIYEPGTHYARHSDRFHQSDARKISVVLYLNENWEPAMGGELMIYHPEREVRIEPTFGKIAIFYSHLEHEVLTSNFQRKSITGWLKGETTVL